MFRNGFRDFGRLVLFCEVVILSIGLVKVMEFVIFMYVGIGGVWRDFYFVF